MYTSTLVDHPSIQKDTLYRNLFSLATLLYKQQSYEQQERDELQNIRNLARYATNEDYDSWVTISEIDRIAYKLDSY